jgi:antitoxin (DNA-binding transcriptional repressor) of toxin-antitoxin stability system
MCEAEIVEVAELQQNLSFYLGKAAAGARMVVIDRCRLVAELAPTGREDRVIAEGRVKPPERRSVSEMLGIELNGDPDALSQALNEVRGRC